MDAEQVAKLFHETYERLAPAFGYSTRKSSRVEWERVPQKNRALMIAVSQSVLNALQSKESPSDSPLAPCNTGSPKLLNSLQSSLSLVKNGMSSEETHRVRGVIADAIDQLRAGA